ncbi:hypothetical protein ABPG77_004123 [Micractinium sp. CCAP 211/92]
MAATKPPPGVVWPLWILLFIGWVLLLSGVAALQQNCAGGNTSNPILGAGSAAYLSPVPCGKFYRFTWWITWYLFAIVILLAILTIATAFHTFRAGLLGLCAPLLILLMDTCNTFFYFNGLNLSGTTKDRARVTLAGAIIATIALFALVLALGVFDEETGKANRRGGTGEPVGETYGGVYQPGAAEKGTAEAATYAYPTRTE